MKRIVLIALALAGAVVPAVAQSVDGGSAERYCGQDKLGRFFYCPEPRRARSRPTPPPAAPAAAPAPEELTYQERLERYNAELEEAKARALMDPTVENVRAYMTMQVERLDRSQQFARVAQRASWGDDQLDYEARFPTAAYASYVQSQGRQDQVEALMRWLPNRYAIYYVYRSDCGYCARFSPVLRNWADTYGIHVQAVSLDGGPNQYFPNARVDQGQLAAMGITSRSVPLVALFDARDRSARPVAVGAISSQELSERIYSVVMAPVESRPSVRRY